MIPNSSKLIRINHITPSIKPSCSSFPLPKQTQLFQQWQYHKKTHQRSSIKTKELNKTCQPINKPNLNSQMAVRLRHEKQVSHTTHQKDPMNIHALSTRNTNQNHFSTMACHNEVHRPEKSYKEHSPQPFNRVDYNISIPTQSFSLTPQSFQTQEQKSTSDLLAKIDNILNYTDQKNRLSSGRMTLESSPKYYNTPVSQSSPQGRLFVEEVYITEEDVREGQIDRQAVSLSPFSEQRNCPTTNCSEVKAEEEENEGKEQQTNPRPQEFVVMNCRNTNQSQKSTWSQQWLQQKREPSRNHFTDLIRQSHQSQLAQIVESLANSQAISQTTNSYAYSVSPPPSNQSLSFQAVNPLSESLGHVQRSNIYASCFNTVSNALQSIDSLTSSYSLKSLGNQQERRLFWQFLQQKECHKGSLSWLTLYPQMHKLLKIQISFPKIRIGDDEASIQTNQSLSYYISMWLSGMGYQDAETKSRFLKTIEFSFPNIPNIKEIATRIYDTMLHNYLPAELQIRALLNICQKGWEYFAFLVCRFLKVVSRSQNQHDCWEMVANAIDS